MKISSYLKFSPGEFRKIMEDLCELHEQKNHDYAGGDYLSDLIASNRMGIPDGKMPCSESSKR